MWPARRIRSRFAEAGGWRFHYLEAGEGPPLVVLPSMLVLARTYRPLLRRLSRRFHVVAVELPGSGRSSRVRRPPESAEHARAAAAFLDRLGLRGVVLVGHSNSGPVALEVALSRPELVSRLVLADIIGANPGDRLARVVLARAVDAVQEPLLSLGAWTHVLWNAAVHPRVLLAQVRAAASSDVLGRAREVRVSTLVAWGTRDATLPPACAERLRRAIPDCSVALRRGGHDWIICRPRAAAELVERHARAAPGVAAAPRDLRAAHAP